MRQSGVNQPVGMVSSGAYLEVRDASEAGRGEEHWRRFSLRRELRIKLQLYGKKRIMKCISSVYIVYFLSCYSHDSTCRAWISSEQKASMRKNAKIKQTTKAYHVSKLGSLIYYACAFLQSLHTLPQDHPQNSTRTLSSPCYVDPDRDMLCYIACVKLL